MPNSERETSDVTSMFSPRQRGNLASCHCIHGWVRSSNTVVKRGYHMYPAVGSSQMELLEDCTAK